MFLEFSLIGFTDQIYYLYYVSYFILISNHSLSNKMLPFQLKGLILKVQRVIWFKELSKQT